MPNAPRRPCRNPGCVELTRDGYCPQHRRDPRRFDRYRGNPSERGYGAKWQRYRRRFLDGRSLCGQSPNEEREAAYGCLSEGLSTPATEVDHIDPVSRGGPFWDPLNHQGLCKTHHSRKTRKEQIEAAATQR